MVREITYNNFKISLVVFKPNIPTNHAITYTNLDWYAEMISAYRNRFLDCVFFVISLVFDQDFWTKERLWEGEGMLYRQGVFALSFFPLNTWDCGSRLGKEL